MESFEYAMAVVAMPLDGSGLCAANGALEVVSGRFGWREMQLGRGLNLGDANYREMKCWHVTILLGTSSVLM